MRKILILVMLFSFVFLSATALAYPNEPDGFRGLTWGTPLERVKDSMVFQYTDGSFGGVDKYTRIDDELSIGAAKLKKIEYGFWQNKLSSVNIEFEGYNNWANLYQSVVARFGEGLRPNRYMDKYAWLASSKASILLEYSDIKRSGYMYIVSKVASDEQNAWQKEQAQKGGKSGF